MLIVLESNSMLLQQVKLKELVFYRGSVHCTCYCVCLAQFNFNRPSYKPIHVKALHSCIYNHPLMIGSMVGNNLYTEMTGHFSCCVNHNKGEFPLHFDWGTRLFLKTYTHLWPLLHCLELVSHYNSAVLCLSISKLTRSVKSPSHPKNGYCPSPLSKLWFRTLPSMTNLTCVVRQLNVLPSPSVLFNIMPTFLIGNATKLVSRPRLYSCFLDDIPEFVVRLMGERN